MPFAFEPIKKDPDTGARLGKCSLLTVQSHTPAFMPVGTQGTVKSLRPDDLQNPVSSNHPWQHVSFIPAAWPETIRKLGGLHTFMNWTGPILTDSGGFRVYSLGSATQDSADGVMFQSHIDGSTLSHPEKAIEIQEALGSDIMMCLDYRTLPLRRFSRHGSLINPRKWAKKCAEANQS